MPDCPGIYIVPPGLTIRNAITGALICDATVVVDGRDMSEDVARDRAYSYEPKQGVCPYRVFPVPGVHHVEVRRGNFQSLSFEEQVSGDSCFIVDIAPRNVDLQPISGDGSCHGSCSTPLCGDCPVTSMVDVGGYSIDATEVGWLAYLQFLNAIPAVDSTLPECDSAERWPLDPGPWPDPPTFRDDFPVRVTFCAARAYCAWAGKRLCGKISGGANGFYDLADPEKSQWYRACSAAGTRRFPYGDDPEAGRCAGDIRDVGPHPQCEGAYTDDSGQPRCVRSRPQCEGGYPGIFDMSGNVAEWEHSCSNRTCRVRGGGWNSRPGADWNSPEAEVFCMEPASADWSVQDQYGFRCCDP